MPQTASPASTATHDEEELIRQALPIVQRMAQRTYHRLGRRIDIDELVSIGLSVLLQAVRRYDPKRARFPAYLVQRLKWSVAGEVRKRTRRLNLDHGLPSGLAGRYSEQQARPLGSERGCDGGRVVSLLERDHQHSGSTWTSADLDNTAMCPSDNPEQALARKYLHAAVHDALAQLPASQRTLMKRHYFEGERFSHVANDIGISKSRAHRLHRAAMRSVARQLTKRGYGPKLRESTGPAQPAGQP